MSSFFFSSSKTLSSSASSFPSSLILSTPSPHNIFSESMMEEKIETAESIINKWDPHSSPHNHSSSLFNHNREEAIEFVNSVKDLREVMHVLVSQNSVSKKLVLAHKLIQVSMKRLEKEFHQILLTNFDHLYPDSVSGRSSNGSSSFDNEIEENREDELQSVGDPMTKMEQVSAHAISDLKLIADCMISSGYGRECVNIYKLIRKSAVDEGLHRIGIEQYKSSHIHRMNKEGHEHAMKTWLNAIPFAVKTILNGERILCDQVFSASDNIRKSCYSEIIKKGAINLFRFPEIIAKSKRWPEQIFRLMDIYEATSILWPEIESMSIFKSTSDIKSQALSSLLKLGDSVRTILLDFETLIQKDSSKIPVAGGGIHPMTRFAMEYVLSLADYSGILSVIVADYPPPSSSFPESYFESSSYEDGPAPAVSIHIAWHILVLLCKLDKKTALYKDVSLSYLFLANNLHFIIQKVQTTNLLNLLGEDWVSENAKKVKRYTVNYESVAWTKVLLSFPDNNYPEISLEAANEAVRRFNAEFEEEYRKQMSWIVPDGKLRDEIKVSLAKKIIPAYREFYDTYSLSGEKNLEKFVRIVPDDLGNYLSDLFHGTSISSSLSLSSTSSWGCMIR